MNQNKTRTFGDIVFRKKYISQIRWLVLICSIDRINSKESKIIDVVSQQETTVVKERNNLAHDI
jgi:hypothetical protein